MKKTIFLLIIILCTIIITGCKVPILSQDIEQLNVEIYDNKIVVGEDLIDQFYYQTEAKEKLILNIKYTHILHPENCSKEYYEEYKDLYPKKEKVKITFDGEKYIYKLNNDRIKTFLYMKKEPKDQMEVITSDEYAYLLTNEENMTFDTYISLLYNQTDNKNINDIVVAIFINSIERSLIFNGSAIDVVAYEKTGAKISVTKEQQDVILNYLDNLDWKNYDSLTQEEKDIINTNKDSDDCLYVYTTRTLVKANIDTPFITVKQNYYSYNLNLTTGYASLKDILSSTQINGVYAKIDTVKLLKIIDYLELDIEGLVLGQTYINPIQEGFGSCRTLTLYNDSTFIYYEALHYSTIIHGCYYITGNELVLTHGSLIDSETKEYIRYEITEDKLIYKEGTIGGSFGKGLSGDLVKIDDHINK